MISYQVYMFSLYYSTLAVSLAIHTQHNISPKHPAQLLHPQFLVQSEIGLPLDRYQTPVDEQ